MTIKKITKRDRFNALLALSEVQADADLVAFIEHEIELLDKKNSSEKKLTAQQTANEGIKDAHDTLFLSFGHSIAPFYY